MGTTGPAPRVLPIFRERAGLFFQRGHGVVVLQYMGCVVISGAVFLLFVMAAGVGSLAAIIWETRPPDLGGRHDRDDDGE